MENNRDYKSSAGENARQRLRVKPALAVLREFNRHTPGAALLAVSRSRIVAEHYAGMASLENYRPIDRYTRFNLASISKTLTATGVMLLAQDGLLDQRHVLTRYFPRWRVFCSGVTVHHLLTHTGGLSANLSPGGQRPRRLATIYGNRDLLDLMLLHRPARRFAPGQRYEYSNLGYCLLAMLIEKVAGEPFDVFMRKRVFDPFGMHSAVVLTERKPVIPCRAQGYGRWPDGEFAFQTMDELTVGDGGVYATARDMLAFWRTFISGRIIKAQYRDMMTLAHVAEPGRGIYYGYGWRHITDGVETLLGHTGTSAGFANFFYFNPATGYLIVLLSNAGWRFPQDERMRIVRECFYGTR